MFITVMFYQTNILKDIPVLTNMLSTDIIHINKSSLEFTINCQAYGSKPKEFESHCSKVISAEQR